MTITFTGATSAAARTAVHEELSTRRLNVMRVGYAFLGMGLVIVRWPVLVQDAGTRSLLFDCSFVVVIIAVIPWGYAWRRYARTPGDTWLQRSRHNRTSVYQSR